MLGATVRIGAGATAALPDDVDLSSPRRAGARPRRCSPRPRARGVPVWGEVELAWRLRDPEHPAPWLARHRHQRQDHHRADARLDPARRRTAPGRLRQRRPAARRGGDGPRAVRRARRGAVQLPAALHLTRWPRSPPPCSTSPRTTSTGTPRMADYAADKGRIYQRVQRACVYNVADPATERLVREADVVEGARAIGFTLGVPGRRDGRARRRRPGRPGVRRAAPARPPPSCARSPTWPRRPRTSWPTRSPRRRWPAPHGVPPSRGPRRAAGLPPRRAPDRRRVATVRRGRLRRRLQGHQPARGQLLAAGLRPGGVGRRRAGQGRLLRRPGAARCATGCAGACCSGRDRAVIAEALARHAPDVPVIDRARATTLLPWTASSGRLPDWPSRATRCCWPRVRVHGHVRELRRSRGCLRRVGAPPPRP